MIVIFGTLADSVTAYICARLCTKRVPFLLLDMRRYLTDFDLSWSIEGSAVEGQVRLGDRRVELSDVRSVWVRWLDLPQLVPLAGASLEQTHLRKVEAYQTIVAFADTVPLLVVNRPAAFGSNSSKSFQSQLIAQCGFGIPRTLVTTEPEEARRFYAECRGRVIYKSVSHLRSIVRRVTADDLDSERLDTIRHCPTQFQEYVPGVDIRVHTVGDQTFATEIITDTTDYRYAARDGGTREMRAITLPPETNERCIRMATAAGMPMSGIDLRRTPSGEYYCFELNPTPGFTFYQRTTGQRIGEALVDALCRGSV